MKINKEIPNYFKSDLISKIKILRKNDDQKKRNLAPTIIEFRKLSFILARHFGFCFGVENAVDIAYRAIVEGAGRRIFLLSEMIHNPSVNEDLAAKGVKFLMSTSGEIIIPITSLSSNDIVIVPAFGTTLELQSELNAMGIDPYLYDTTCPFVEKVWKKAEEIGLKGFTIVIHGKSIHEETRATFSHASKDAPAVVVKDIAEAKILAQIILNDNKDKLFEKIFSGRINLSFNPENDLKRIGVVNQTTMLASETLEISKILKESMVEKYGPEAILDHFAITKDTLCYATNENQNSVIELAKYDSDLALVIGGYNSSNTSHLYELLDNTKRIKTYYIKDSSEIISDSELTSYNYFEQKVVTNKNWLPLKEHLKIAITAGASCPDKNVEDILTKIAKYYDIDALEDGIIKW